jgi:hypothetical protein
MGTRYCDTSGALLDAQIVDGDLFYLNRTTGQRHEARDEDHVLMVAAIKDTTQVVTQFANMIRDSPFDPLFAREAQSCPAGCGSDTMTYLRLGPDEIFIYTCDCGAVVDAKNNPIELPPAPAPLYPLAPRNS